MLLNVDGLDESTRSPSSICGLTDVDVDASRDPAIPSETFWDCSPYADLAQTWLDNDVFSSCYGREKDSTLTITFPGNMDSESTPTLFPAEHSVLKQSNFAGDPWNAFLSPDLTNSANDTCSPSLFVQKAGKENNPPPDSPTLNDFADFSGAIWTDSLIAEFNSENSILGLRDTVVSTPELSPPTIFLPQVLTRSRGQRKGLLGWGDTRHLQTSSPAPSVLRPRSSSRSSAILDSYTLTSNTGSPPRKRPRQSTISRGSPSIESESLSVDSSDGDASLDESDSDDYLPTCSPSPKFARFKAKPSLCSPLPPKPAFRTLKPDHISKTKKKLKGSAALALAVVTQIGEAKREAQTLSVPLDSDSFDPVRDYYEGSYVAKKRRNQPIPVPIPVPNLNKTSRGRKVPFVSNCESPIPSSVDALSTKLQTSTRSRRKLRTVSAPDESGASRSYVCVIPGCGKCFVRGEHLKRHVRSIHTNDKPHVCPVEGCDKSFSRRDNLGQHVRIHLQL